MKRSILAIGVILISVNLSLGLIVTAYRSWNLIASTIIISLTTLILLVVNGGMRLSDGYKASLNILIPVIGVIQYLISILIPNYFSNNWGLISIIVLATIEAILLVASNNISINNNKLFK